MHYVSELNSFFTSVLVLPSGVLELFVLQLQIVEDIHFFLAKECCLCMEEINQRCGFIRQMVFSQGGVGVHSVNKFGEVECYFFLRSLQPHLNFLQWLAYCLYSADPLILYDWLHINLMIEIRRSVLFLEPMADRKSVV